MKTEQRLQDGETTAYQGMVDFRASVYNGRVNTTVHRENI